MRGVSSAAEIARARVGLGFGLARMAGERAVARAAGAAVAAVEVDTGAEVAAAA